MILAEGLEANSTLIDLDVASNDLESVKAARYFGEALGQVQRRKADGKSVSALHELNLSACYIGPKQMDELIEGLSRNRTLTTLHLDSNSLDLRGFRAVRFLPQFVSFVSLESA